MRSCRNVRPHFLFTVKFASKRSLRMVTTDLGGYSQRLQSTACGQAANTKNTQFRYKTKKKVQKIKDFLHFFGLSDKT